MSKPKLTYFDAAASRGEECRLALHIAGVDFEDDRIKFKDWPELKPKTPFGAMPILEVPGKPPLAQVNAVLVYIGRTNGLHPEDDFEAAQHEAIMVHAEDLRLQFGPTLFLPEEEKKKRRQEIAASYLPSWGARAERHIGAGPFFGGEKIHVADLKLYMVTRWIRNGTLDHVPATSLADFPKLNRLHDAVVEHPAVKSWYARS